MAPILVAFVVVLILSVAALVVAVVGIEKDRDWYQVANVNGTSIDRGQLRFRLAFEQFLFQQQLKALSQAVLGGRISASDSAQTQTALETTGDPVIAARDGLVDDTLTIQLATAMHPTTTQRDPWLELADFLEEGYDRRLRWVSITAQPGGPSSPPAIAAVKAAVQELAGTESIDTIVRSVSLTGAQASGRDQWISEKGTVAGVDDQLVRAARQAPSGSILGPYVDRRGNSFVGVVLGINPTNPVLPSTLAEAAASAKVDSATVAYWAQAELARVGLQAALTTRWSSTGLSQVKIDELVIGPAEAAAADPGPWVELSQLNLDRVPLAALAGSSSSPEPTAVASAGTGSPEAPGTSGQPLSNPFPIAAEGAVVAWLKNLPVTDRVAGFTALAAAANSGNPSGTDQSGELGFLGRADLADSIGGPAFGPPPSDGLIGPVTIEGHPRLFLIEARYAGSLDERSRAALVMARGPAADLKSLAAEFAPDEQVLAVDGGWWSRPEFAATDPAGSTLFGTPIGSLSDPLVLDNELAVVRPTEIRTAVPDPLSAARLAIDGFGAWFADQRSAASITLAPDPLPEAEPSSATGPTPSIPSLAPLETPFLPSIPALSSPGPDGPVFPGGGPITPPPLGPP